MDIWTALAAPTHALPLDVLRIAVGAISLAYFARTWREAPLFSGPDGLIDHSLLRRILPFTRVTLFPAGASLRLLRSLYAVGAGAALLLTLGVATFPVSLFLYVLAVCTYRWNFLVIYVDDAVMHLALFWMVILPIGHTLALPTLLADPAGVWTEWQSTSVPGLAVRCFLFNMALVYLVAGLWKYRSPMWRQASALHASLRMAVAYMPDLWRLPLRPWLKLGNYFALIVEPMLALLVVAPAHAPLKWALLAGAAAFHLGIVATMKFPFANLLMLGALVVFFSPELMAWLGTPDPAPLGAALGAADWVALTTVVCLALLFALNVRWFPAPATTMRWLAPSDDRPPMNPFYLPLWLIGLAQSYRLFDWIDERNYRAEYEVIEQRGGQTPRKVDPATMFPRSIRHVLLQSYLYGNLWVKLHPSALPELRASILFRYARRYCLLHPDAEGVEVYANVGRLTGDNLDLHRVTRTHLISFTNMNGEPRLTHMCLAPPDYR